ncbi:MAG: hypothetical protein EXQ52_14510 [Bryobacterales bacterium]|nr:hypothetical protein [Bryobacterales bacterium]
MLKWFRAAKEAPLKGAPSIRRQKTYSGQSGYVYQYFYEGCRAAERNSSSGTQYVFRVSSDRRTDANHSIFVAEAAVSAWEQANGRPLNSTERYAVAKLALFQAFDERPTPEDAKREVAVEAADVETFLATLDIG